MTTRVYIVGTVARLEAPIVLIMQQFVLHANTVLAGDASHMLILLQILLQFRMQKLVCVHTSDSSVIILLRVLAHGATLGSCGLR